jgi:Arc/MetJ family transcription regulator
VATRAVKTIDVDAGLLAETRNAMKPSTHAPDAEVVERALRAYLGGRALDASQAMSEFSEEEALRDRQRGAPRYAERASQRRVTRVVIDPGVLVSAFISPKKAAPGTGVRVCAGWRAPACAKRDSFGVPREFRSSFSPGCLTPDSARIAYRSYPAPVKPGVRG